MPSLAWPTFDASTHDPSNVAGKFGLIPQDAANTYGYEAAAAQCKIVFGHAWDLATFDSTAQLSEVTTFVADEGYTEAFWVGYRNSETGQVDHFGNTPLVTFPWNTGFANPEPNGPVTDCVRVKEGLFNDVDCGMDRTGNIKNGIGMSVICRQYPNLDVNPNKVTRYLHVTLIQNFIFRVSPESIIVMLVHLAFI